jgi:hypothetical protein
MQTFIEIAIVVMLWLNLWFLYGRIQKLKARLDKVWKALGMRDDRP